MPELNDTDKNLIRLLQNGEMCVPKINKIAKSLQLPPSTIHSRIEKLKKKGIITGYNAVVNPEKIGKKLTVFALLKLKYPENPHEVAFDELVAQKIAASSPNVQEVHSLTGDWELLVKIKAKDTEDYYKTAKECFITAGKIVKVNGLMTLSTIKENQVIWP